MLPSIGIDVAPTKLWQGGGSYSELLVLVG